VNLVSYYRILIPRLLPADVERVVYLDCDLVICADLVKLWKQRLAGHRCLAVQDCSAPYMDSAVALPNYAKCAAFVGCRQPVPNFRELGLPAEVPYFNAGVLLIDLRAWREADVSAQLLSCLEKNRQHVRWWDQYAMNVVLAGHWGRLDARWNQGSHIYKYPSWQLSPFDQLSYEQQTLEPYIVHYTTAQKPWRASCRHILRERFYDYLDRTDWAGWRPPRWAVFLEALRAQERRLRRGRKWLTAQARQWWQNEPERRAA
jgi:lipopolysaccharide biosynthesis glycosyltransferase